MNMPMIETEYGRIEVRGDSLTYVDFDHDRFWEERSPSYTWPQACYSEVTAAVAEALGADAVRDETTDYGVRTLLTMPDGRERWLRADHEAIFWEE